MSFIEMKDPIAAENSLRRTWDELRHALQNGELSPDDICVAKQYTFLKVFDELFSNEQKCFKRWLEEFDVLKFARCCRLKSLEAPSYERFLPKAEFITADNRFSPAGVEWLYLACGQSIDHAEECARKECRINDGDIAGFCEFQTKNKKAQIVDLTIAEEHTYSSINAISDEYIIDTARRYAEKILLNGCPIPTKEELGKQLYSPSHEMAELWVVFTYTKIFSKELFIPADGNASDKKNQYAPFQCLAYYFQSLGYDGIAYPSTVCSKGRNIVLFDKTMATPVGDIKVKQY